MNKLSTAGCIKLPKSDCDRNFIKYSQKKTEEILFVLHPSLLRYFTVILLCILTFWAVLPLLILILVYYQNRATKYIITNERIRILKGLLVRRIVDLELYRVKDISLVVPLHLKIFKLGSIELVTSDPSNPYIALEAINNLDELEEVVRYNVDRRRAEKNVQEIDQYRYEKK